MDISRTLRHKGQSVIGGFLSEGRRKESPRELYCFSL